MQREISGYAQLSQAAMKSTRMIADNVIAVETRRRRPSQRLTADRLRHSIAAAFLQRERGGFIWSRSHELKLAFELAGPWLRPRQDAIARRSSGNIFMESIRPDNTDPIPLRSSPHRMGTIMIRFVGLLFAGGGGSGADLEPLISRGNAPDLTRYG